MILTKICIVCCNEFDKVRTRSLKSWKTATFCSRDCQVKGRVYINLRGGFKKGLTPWNKGMVGVCLNTGRTHFKKGISGSPQTQFKKGRTSYWKGKKNPHFAGINNPKWKGGVTPEHLKVRWSVEMKNFRKEIFERDDYTCKACGRRSKQGDKVILNIHHIKPFAIYKELRFDKDNVITLCIECHSKTDTYKGKLRINN